MAVYLPNLKYYCTVPPPEDRKFLLFCCCCSRSDASIVISYSCFHSFSSRIRFKTSTLPKGIRGAIAAATKCPQKNPHKPLSRRPISRANNVRDMRTNGPWNEGGKTQVTSSSCVSCCTYSTVRAGWLGWYARLRYFPPEGRPPLPRNTALYSLECCPLPRRLQNHQKCIAKSIPFTGPDAG